MMTITLEYPTFWSVTAFLFEWKLDFCKQENVNTNA